MIYKRVSQGGHCCIVTSSSGPQVAVTLLFEAPATFAPLHRFFACGRQRQYRPSAYRYEMRLEGYNAGRRQAYFWQIVDRISKTWSSRHKFSSLMVLLGQILNMTM